MFPNTAAFGGLLVQNECPFQGGHPQGGPGSPCSLARQPQTLLQRAQEECCKPWCSPVKGQGQSLPGCSPTHLNHSSLMALFCSRWSRTSCDVYHRLPGTTYGSVLPLKQSFCSSLWACRKTLQPPRPCASVAKTWSSWYPKLQGGGNPLKGGNPKRELQHYFNPVTVLQEILPGGKAFSLIHLWLESLFFHL